MLTTILLAIALSLDAFSLCLCIGTLNISIKKIIYFSTIIGVFHFIMPMLGMMIGDILLRFIVMDLKYITSIIFFLLSIFILFEKDEKDNIVLNNITLLSLAFLVSIDSFIAGIGINNIDNRHLLNSITFSLFSFSFSFIALKIGKYINLKLGDISKVVAAVLLIVISIIHLTKS